MLNWARVLVVAIGATWMLTGQATAQSGIYKTVLADCMAAGHDRGRCSDYAYCVQSAMRRDLTAAEQLEYVINPKNPKFLKWAERTKRYCIDEARLPPGTPAAKVTANDPENTLLILTTAGLIKIALLPDKAPKHVAGIKKLVREKYYDDRAFALQDLGEGGISIPYDPQHRPARIPMEPSGDPLDRGFVVIGGEDNKNTDSGAEFSILRRYNQNSNRTIVGRVAEGLDVLDGLKAPDTRPRVFGYPPRLYFEPDRVLAVRIAGDPNSSDIKELENKKKERLAARVKKNAEHARRYGAEVERLKRIISNVTGEWTGISKSQDGRDIKSEWQITKQNNAMASSKMTLYSALSASIVMHDETGKTSGPFNLRGQIEGDNLSFNFNLNRGAMQCAANWTLHAKSDTEFEGVWTGKGVSAACSAPAPNTKIHLQKK